MNEVAEQPGPCQCLEVQAGLAELNAVALDLANGKTLADEFVQAHSAYRQLAARRSRWQPDVLDDLFLDQRQGCSGRRACGMEVTVALKPTPSVCAHSRDEFKRASCLGTKMDGDQAGNRTPGVRWPDNRNGPIRLP